MLLRIRRAQPPFFRVCCRRILPVTLPPCTPEGWNRNSETRLSFIPVFFSRTDMTGKGGFTLSWCSPWRTDKIKTSIPFMGIEFSTGKMHEYYKRVLVWFFHRMGVSAVKNRNQSRGGSLVLTYFPASPAKEITGWNFKGIFPTLLKEGIQVWQ